MYALRQIAPRPVVIATQKGIDLGHTFYDKAAAIPLAEMPLQLLHD